MVHHAQMNRSETKKESVAVPFATTPGQAPSVLLQQICIPHYRQALFELLSASPDIRFTIAADVEPDTPFLEVVRVSESTIRHRLAKAYSIDMPRCPRFSWQPGLVRLMLQERPDVVIAQGSPYVLTTWVLLVLGRMSNIPVLLWTHGLQGDESGAKWFVRKLLYRLATGLLLYGDHAKRLLIGKSFEPERLYVLYNSLDYQTQKAVASALSDEDVKHFRRSLGIPAEDRIVIYTGRLQPVKRLPLLLDAIGLLNRRGRRVHVVLVGDGRERPALVAQADTLGIAELVHFMGALYNERELAVAISASDLSVIPSGAGLSIMHALAYGTPVLLHDRVEEHFPEWEAVTEGVTGFYYRYGDIEHLAEKIDAALFPHSKKTEMAMACRDVIEHRYNPRRHAEAIMEAVESIREKAAHRNLNSRAARPYTKEGL